MQQAEPNGFEYRLSGKQLERKLVNIAVASYTRDCPTMDIVKYAAACIVEFDLPDEIRFRMLKDIIHRLIGEVNVH